MRGGMEERKVVVRGEGKGAARRKSQKPEAPETKGLRGLGVCFASPDGAKVTH